MSFISNDLKSIDIAPWLHTKNKKKKKKKKKKKETPGKQDDKRSPESGRTISITSFARLRHAHIPHFCKVPYKKKTHLGPLRVLRRKEKKGKGIWANNLRNLERKTISFCSPKAHQGGGLGKKNL